MQRLKLKRKSFGSKFPDDFWEKCAAHDKLVDERVRKEAQTGDIMKFDLTRTAQQQIWDFLINAPKDEIFTIVDISERLSMSKNTVKNFSRKLVACGLGTWHNSIGYFGSREATRNFQEFHAKLNKQISEIKSEKNSRCK